MRILFVGDVVCEPGRRIVRRALPQLRADSGLDLVVVNGENAAAGRGLTPAMAEELFAAGADVITTGNHVWAHKSIRPYIGRTPRLLRPANLLDAAPGSGVYTVVARDATQVAVICLLGRVFMNPVENPFHCVDRLLAELPPEVRTVLVDFHAEATSEKVALGRFLDGRVSAVLGTHTHVATADECILPLGTAYITDVGMTGPHDSVIGCDTERVIAGFVDQTSPHLIPATADVRLCAVLVETDDSGRAVSIRRLRIDSRDLPPLETPGVPGS